MTSGQLATIYAAVSKLDENINGLSENSRFAEHSEEQSNRRRYNTPRVQEHYIPSGTPTSPRQSVFYQEPEYYQNNSVHRNLQTYQRPRMRPVDPKDSSDAESRSFCVWTNWAFCERECYQRDRRSGPSTFSNPRMDFNGRREEPVMQYRNTSSKKLLRAASSMRPANARYVYYGGNVLGSRGKAKVSLWDSHYRPEWYSITFHPVYYNQLHCYINKESDGNNKFCYQVSYWDKNKINNRNKTVRFNKVNNTEGIWSHNNRKRNVNRDRSYPHTGDTDAICKLIDDRNKVHDRMLRERKLRFMHRANRHDQGDAAGRNKDLKLASNDSINKIMGTNSIGRNSSIEHKTRVKLNKK